MRLLLGINRFKAQDSRSLIVVMQASHNFERLGFHTITKTKNENVHAIEI